jgi:hypothetical protein
MEEERRTEAGKVIKYTNRKHYVSECVCMRLGFELRALPLLHRYSITWPMPPDFWKHFFIYVQTLSILSPPKDESHIISKDNSEYPSNPVALLSDHALDLIDTTGPQDFLGLGV